MICGDLTENSKRSSLMQKRKLGRTDLETAPIVFGGNVFGWTIDEATSHAILDKFFELGFNTIDTADVYSRWVEGNQGGESETIIGNWIKSRGNRDQVTIITKVGLDVGQGAIDLSEKHILKGCDDSLRRLQIDTIDLYLTHRDDNKTPVEETLGAYQKLIDAGKVRYIGASNLTPERFSASLQASERDGLPRYEVYQPEYNLYERSEFENGVGPICRDNEIGVITYYALASGFLTGKYRDKSDLGQSVRGGGVEKYLNEKGERILKALDDISTAHGVSQAAIALAWQFSSPFVTAPIASATKPHHLEAFREAVSVELSADEIAVLDIASAY